MTKQNKRAHHVPELSKAPSAALSRCLARAPLLAHAQLLPQLPPRVIEPPARKSDGTARCRSCRAGTTACSVPRRPSLPHLQPPLTLDPLFARVLQLSIGHAHDSPQNHVRLAPRGREEHLRRGKAEACFAIDVLARTASRGQCDCAAGHSPTCALAERSSTPPSAPWRACPGAPGD